MFKCTEANLLKLEEVKRIIPKGIRCAFEFRDPAWFIPETLKNPRFKALFTDNWTQAILYLPEIRHLNEKPDEATFGQMSGGTHVGIINPKFLYIRFHGTTGYSMGTYGAERMLNVLNLISETQPKVLCAYFNNTDSWTMPRRPEMEGDYKRVPLKIPILPSAIYDAQLLDQLLH